MVHIYAAKINGLPDPKEFPEIMERLPQARKEKTVRCLFSEKRKQSLGAGLLLEYVLQLYGKSSADIKIGANGKPEIEGIFFNLSHTGDVAVCAVSDKAVGCDVEQVVAEPKNVAERFFCKRENKYLDAFCGEERERQFFRIWTMKESYMKMTGEGMRLALNRVEFVLGDAVQVYRDGGLCSCFIKEYEIPGYCCSVCSEGNLFADGLEWVDLLEFKESIKRH